MNITDFKARLRDGNIAGWYILAGEEEYLKRYYRQEIKKIAAPDDDAFATFNHIIFDGADMDVASLREALYSPPMMSDYKLIEWRHAEPDKLREGEIKLIEELAESKDDYPYAVLLFTTTAEGFDTGTDRRPSKLYSRLSRGFDILVFEKSSDAQLLAWLKRHFDNDGIAVDAETLNTMLFRVGHSMQMLREEVTKLSCYAKANGRRFINVQDVLETCSATIECDAFAISNAIIEKNAEKAFLALADMKQNRVEPQAAIAQLSKVYSDLVSISLLVDEGRESKDIEEIMGFHPYRLKLYMGAAKKIGTRRLAESLDSLIKMDSAAKSGGIGGFKTVEMFITQNL